MMQAEELVQKARCSSCGHGTCPSWCLGEDPIAEWVALGACSDADPELFFPIGRAGRRDVEATIEAKRICNSCPVRRDCLEFAVEENLDHGVWGGATPSERRYQRREILATLKKRRANEKRLEEIR